MNLTRFSVVLDVNFVYVDKIVLMDIVQTDAYDAEKMIPMPSLSRKIDWSVPRPAGYSPLGTNGVLVPYPTVKYTPLNIHNIFHHFYPYPDFIGGSPTPVGILANHQGRVPFTNPRWPRLPFVRGNPTILDTPGILKEP